MQFRTYFPGGTGMYFFEFLGQFLNDVALFVHLLWKKTGQALWVFKPFEQWFKNMFWSIAR